MNRQRSGCAQRSRQLNGRGLARCWQGVRRQWAGRIALLEGLEARVCLSGSLGAAVSYPVWGTANFIDSADLNADGRNDLVTSSHADSSLSLLPGNGDGTFQASQRIALANAPDFVTVADVNGDGKPDLVTASFDTNTVSVLIGNGNGTFQAAASYAAGTGPRAVVVGDFTGDGKADLVVAKSYDATLTILRNAGNGTFLAAVTTSLSITPCDLVAGDFNGDGKLDLGAADFFSDKVAIIPGNGNGTFQAPWTISSGTGPTSIAAGDFNGDGKLDLASANYLAGTVSVFRGSGTGTLLTPTTLVAASGTTFVAAADVDRDGKSDLVAANANADRLSVFWGNGDGSFGSAVSYATGESPRSLVIADLDGTSMRDIAVANEGASQISVLIGGGPAGPTANAGGPYSVPEGGTVQLNGGSSTGDGLTYAWDLDGDGIYGESGSAATRGTETGSAPTFSAAGLDGPSSRTIGLRVTDSVGQTSTSSATINITNVAPTVTIGGAASVNEGSTYTLALSRTDPGIDTISKWVIAWGDGATQTITGNPSSATHVFADNGSYTVSATATDEDGTYSAGSKVVSVTNVAPTLTIGGASSVAEGSTYTLTLSRTDPGNDSISKWVITWGDGATQTISGNPSSATHAFADNGSYTISATATDEDGTYSANTKAVSVTNVAPSLTIGGVSFINEGSTYTLALSRTDPGNDTISQWVITWGDGATQTITGNPASATHVFADNGSYTISATATDEDGTYAANSKTLTVANVAPALTISGAGSVSTGTPYALGLASSDPGADTLINWTINWGDGTIQTVSGAATSASHTYSGATAIYTVTASATDEDGTYAANPLKVSVLGTAPLADPGGGYEVAEGQTVALDGSGSLGQGLTYAWDLDGDGTYGESGASATRGDETGPTPTFSAAGLDGPSSRTISLRVTDSVGQTSTASATINITNVAPTLAIGGASSVAEGSTYTLSLSTSDPGIDTISKWVIAWGDGATQTITGNPSSATHVFADNGSYTISATATDEDGTYSAGSKVVSVTNVAPTLTVIGSNSAAAGGSYTLSLSASDPGDDTISQWVINWGDGTIQTVAGNPSSVAHTYAAGGNVIIQASASDEDGTWAAASKALSVSAPNDKTRPSAAVSSAPPVLTGDSITYSFTVKYTDNYALNIGTFDSGDIRVTGPNGFSQLATFISSAGTASSRVATYSITSPGGAWEVADNGTYTLTLLAGQVRDAAGNYAGSVTLGTFKAGLLPPDTAGYDTATARLLGAMSGGVIRASEDGVGALDRNDFYKITLAAGTSIWFKLYNLTDNADMYVLDSGGTVVASGRRSGTSAESFTKTLKAGSYYIRMRYASTAGTAYRLRIEGTGTAAAAPGDNVPGGARYMGTPDSGQVRAVDGYVGTDDPTDYCSVRIVRSMPVYIKLTGLSDNANLDLLDSAGRVIKSSGRGGSSDEPIRLSLAAGTYYLRVRFAGVRGTNYRVRVAG